MEVIQLQNQLVAPDVLIAPNIVGPRALRSRRHDVILRNVGRVTGLLQQRVKAEGLDPQRRFLHPGRRVGAQQCPVKPLRVRKNGGIRQSNARGAGNAVEMVLLDTSPSRIEEPALHLALKLQRVFEVRPLGLLIDRVGRRLNKTATLVLVSKTEQRAQVMAEAVVGLIVQLVAVGVLIVAWNEELGPTRCRVPIGAANRDDVAEVLGDAECRGRATETGSVIDDDRRAGVAERHLLLPPARDAVAHQVVPSALQPVLQRQPRVKILIALLGAGRNPVEVVPAR